MTPTAYTNQMVAFPPSTGGTFSVPEFGDTTESITVPSYTPAGSYTVTVSQSQSDLSGGANATPSGYTILSSTKSVVNTNGATLSFSSTSNNGDVTIAAVEPSQCFINSSHTYEYSITANVNGLSLSIANDMAVAVTNGDTLQFSFVPDMHEQPSGTILYISVYVK